MMTTAPLPPYQIDPNVSRVNLDICSDNSLIPNMSVFPGLYAPVTVNTPGSSLSGDPYPCRTRVEQAMTESFGNRDLCSNVSDTTTEQFSSKFLIYFLSLQHIFFLYIYFRLVSYYLHLPYLFIDYSIYSNSVITICD